MQLLTIAVFVALCCCLASQGYADDVPRREENQAVNFHESSAIQPGEDENAGLQLHSREKRTLFLKKKLIGAGLLGFGLGIAKGYKAAYFHAPEVHHVYLSPPPPQVKYVEYVEKPYYFERIVEKPGPYGAW